MAAPSNMTHKMAARHTSSKRTAGATMYECSKCHMKVSATAKKDHDKDPMDGGKFIPAKGGTKLKLPKGAKAIKNL